MLKSESNYFKRSIREALEIKCKKTGPNQTKGLNRDIGKYVTSNAWNQSLKKSAIFKIFVRSSCIVIFDV